MNEELIVRIILYGLLTFLSLSALGLLLALTTYVRKKIYDLDSDILQKMAYIQVRNLEYQKDVKSDDKFIAACNNIGNELQTLPAETIASAVRAMYVNYREG